MKNNIEGGPRHNPKDKYNFPKHAHNSNNHLYNQWVEAQFYNGFYCGGDEFCSDWDGISPVPEEFDTNYKTDEYRQPKDGNGFQEDAYTVAQKFIDRTQFPLG